MIGAIPASPSSKLQQTKNAIDSDAPPNSTRPGSAPTIARLAYRELRRCVLDSRAHPRFAGDRSLPRIRLAGERRTVRADLPYPSGRAIGLEPGRRAGRGQLRRKHFYRPANPVARRSPRPATPVAFHAPRPATPVARCSPQPATPVAFYTPRPASPSLPRSGPLRLGARAAGSRPRRNPREPEP